MCAINCDDCEDRAFCELRPSGYSGDFEKWDGIPESVIFADR